MSPANVATPEILEQAAQWAARLHENSLNEGELSEHQRAELQRWLLADERHAAEFKAHNVLLALATDPSSGLCAGAHSNRSAKTRAFMRRPARFWAAAAVLVMLVTALMLWLSPRETSATYMTRAGESLHVRIDEGAEAYLNTKTQLEWLGTRHSERRVALIEGEVLLDVHPDATRPFVLEVGDVEIRVLGTRFNVYRRTEGVVTVTVLEGAVAVAARGGSGGGSAWIRTLRENQTLDFSVSGVVRDVRTTDALRAVKWREGFLSVANMSLPDLLREFARYTDKRIVITDPRVASVHAGGAMSVRNLRATLDGLSKMVPQLTVAETHDAFLIGYRNEDPDEDPGQQ